MSAIARKSWRPPRRIGLRGAAAPNAWADGCGGGSDHVGKEGHSIAQNIAENLTPREPLSTRPRSKDTARQDPKRLKIQEKLSRFPNFTEDCTERFYSGLFDVMPGVESMFGDFDRQKRMFRLMVDLMVRAITDDVRLDAYMVEIGRKHRKAGVMPMHMRIGREPMLQAIAEACPDLTESERDYFGAMYGRIVDAMMRRA